MDKIIGLTSGTLRNIGHVVVISEAANVITNFDDRDRRVVGSFSIGYSLRLS